MELKPEAIFSINDFDVANVLDRPVKMSQQQLGQIAKLMVKYMYSHVGDEFWNTFDSALEQASLKVLYPEDNL